MADFPTRAYANQLVNRTNLLAHFYPNVSQVTYEQLLKSHLIALDIYYSDMKYTLIEEIEKTKFLDLVSGVGGTLGLFIGMSFLSFFEIFDVIIELVYVIMCQRVCFSGLSNNNRVVFVQPSKA